MKATIRVFLLLPERRNRRELVKELNVTQSFHLLGMAGTFSEIDMSFLVSNPPHVFVADFDQTEVRELRIWSALKCFLPMDTRVVAITSGLVENTLEFILAIGVNALHPPTISSNRLLEAISIANAGQIDFDSELADRARMLFVGDPRPDRVIVGGLCIALSRPVISRWGQEIHLSPLETGVMQHLARNLDRWVSTDELLDAVWKVERHSGGTSDQVKSCIKRLKDKVEPDSDNPRYIFSSRSDGYRLQDPL